MKKRILALHILEPFLVCVFVLVVAMVVSAQITVPYTFTSGNTISSSQINSNFSTIDAAALNRTAGTMTGTLTAQSVIPSTTLTYALGSSSFVWNTAFIGTATITDGSAIALLNATNLGSGTVNTARLGSGTASGNYLRGDNTWQAVAQVPASTVIFFDGGACPTGWAELTSARGRYLVGLPAGGTLDATTGTALTDAENRPSGQHTHVAAVTDPGHTHSLTGFADTAGAVAGGATVANPGSGTLTAGIVGSSTTGITVSNANPAGSVAGTNAPFLQLLVCKKS